eukprot:COSAG01_NODE_2972_length_6774_cov_7.923146_2_plen_93_part_00
MANHSSSCQAADLALVLGRFKDVFNVSVVVDVRSRGCSVPDITHGYRYTGVACFVATSRFRQPGTGYTIIGRIDESRYTTMEHQPSVAPACL